MAQYGFGSGALWGINSGSNQTPVRFGALQDCSVDFSSTIKELFGSNQYALSVARGTMKVSGKASVSQFDGRLYSDLFFGTSLSGGQILAIDSEPGSVPGTSTYTITVVNSATWTLDLGVTYAATGIPLTRVSSVAAIGQYSVAAGVYTFYSGDASAAVKLSYVYTTTGGDNITIANVPMGQANTFKTVLSLPYNSQKMTVTLNSCVSNKLSLTTALEDFTKQDFEFGCFVDSAGNVGTISIAELS